MERQETTRLLTRAREGSREALNEVYGRFAGQEAVISRVIDFALSLLENTRGGLIAGIGLALLSEADLTGRRRTHRDLLPDSLPKSALSHVLAGATVTNTATASVGGFDSPEDSAIVTVPAPPTLVGNAAPLGGGSLDQQARDLRNTSAGRPNGRPIQS